MKFQSFIILAILLFSCNKGGPQQEAAGEKKSFLNLSPSATSSSTSTLLNVTPGSLIVGGGLGLAGTETGTGTATGTAACKACSDMLKAIRVFSSAASQENLLPTLSDILRNDRSADFKFCIRLRNIEELQDALTDQKNNLSSNGEENSKLTHAIQTLMSILQNFTSLWNTLPDPYAAFDACKPLDGATP